MVTESIFAIDANVGEIGDEDLTFLTGMHTMTTAGDVNTQAGMATHIYLATKSMENEVFFNADGELMVVPGEPTNLKITGPHDLDVATALLRALG